MIGTPFTAGSLASSASSATYPVPVSTPVPPGAAVVMFAGAAGATVTATQSGTGAANGMVLTVKAVTGAAAVQNGATGANDTTATSPELTVTPAGTGSWVYGATTFGAGATAFTPAAGTTFSANTPDTAHGIAYGTFRSTGTTTSGTPITVGATAPTTTGGSLGVAVAEILASGTLAEDPSSPAVASTFTALSVTTAPFSPPPDSLLVAMVCTDWTGTGVNVVTITDTMGLTWTRLAQSPTQGVASVFIARVPHLTSATGVTDSQGNTYTLSASSTSNEYLQAFTATAVTGLNQLAGDTWTITYAAANTQAKLIVAVAAPGASATDITAAANGNSASPSVSGTAASGNEVAIACWQSAAAVPAPSSFTLLTSLSSGISAAYGYSYITQRGAVTAAATATSGPWAAAMVTLTASAPVALGSGSSPSGGVQLPPYPVLPSPRTWFPVDKMLTPLLRADPGNAISLLANPPLVITGQTTTTQSVPNATVTPLTLDTDLLDTWQSHTIPNSTVSPPLAGWYLTEGFVFLNDTVTATTCTAGIQAVQGGTTTSSDGAKVSDNGVNFPVPNVADLVQINPATADSIALYCWQDSGASKNVASAYLKTEWVAASSGTAVTSPVPAAGWTSGATALLAAVSAGATSVLVADPTGIVAGGTLALDYGNAATENVIVTTVSGQTIGITTCTYGHPSSAPVSVPVSAAWMNQQIRDKIRFLSYRPIARLSSQGGSQSLPSQTWPAGTAITWVNPATSGINCTDNFSGWASGNPTQYTFPVSGTWYLYGQVYLADAASPVLVSAGLAISGGTIWWGDRTLSTGVTTKGVCATVRRVVRVAAGQYAEIYGSQGSGGSLAVRTTSTTHSRMIALWRGF